MAVFSVVIALLIGICLGAAMTTIFQPRADDTCRKAKKSNIPSAQQQRISMVLSKVESRKAQNSKKMLKRARKWENETNRAIVKAVADGRTSVHMRIYCGKDMYAPIVCGAKQSFGKQKPFSHWAEDGSFCMFLCDCYGNETASVVGIVCASIMRKYECGGYDISITKDINLSGWHYSVCISWADSRFANALLKVESETDARAFADHGIPLHDIVAGR